MGRLIDADALLNAICGCFNAFEASGIDMTTARAIVISIVNNAPAVDAVPVVRCGECKYYAPPQGFCYVVQGTPREDFYCAAGKRREENDDGT